MKYKATIIIPCYNKEEYLNRSLDSIVGLSRFKDFEVIIVDDHSSDNSVKIIKEYAKKYDNIKLIVLEKGSGSASKPRNTGIENSTADYLIFMDPDDCIINDGYSVLLNKMEEYDSDIVIGTRVGMTLAGQKVFTDFIDERFTYVNSNDYEVKYDLLYRLPYILKTIYKKSLIVDNDIYFNEKISTSEDESFDIMCASYATKITKINDIVYRYTVEAPGSTTTNVSMKMFKELYDIMCELEKAYTIYFSDEVAMEKIAKLITGFYVGRITFFKSSKEIDEAFAITRKAIEDFGYEKFLVMEDGELLEAITSIKDDNYRSLIQNRFINRINTLEKRLRKSEKELQRVKSLHNRKIVKVAIKTANKISALKNR